MDPWEIGCEGMIWIHLVLCLSVMLWRRIRQWK